MIGGRLAPVAIVFVLHNVQMHMMRPYVPLFAATLDAGYLLVGVVAAAVGFLPIFLALPAGSLSDRWGAGRIVAVAGAINAIGFALLAIYPNLAVILVSQMLAGLANLLVSLSTQAYVGGLGRGRAAERNFSAYSMFASIGQVAGPLIGGLIISLAGFQFAFVVATSLSLLSIAAATVLLPWGAKPQWSRPIGAFPRRAWKYLKMRDTQLTILASCLMAVPEILRSAFLPLYLGAVVHLDVGLVGYVLAIFALAGLAAKTILPSAVERFGRQTMLFSFTAGCALALLAIPFTASIWVACVITACMGLTFGLGRPLSMAMAANAAAPNEEAFVVALRLSGNRVADVILPVAFGSAAAAFGIGAAFVAGAAVLVAGAVVLVQPMVAEIRERRDGRNSADAGP